MHLLLAAESVEANAVMTGEGILDLVWLIPLVPLLGFAFTLGLGDRARERLAIGASAVTFVLSIFVFLAVQGEPAAHVTTIGTFIDVGGFTVDWAFMVDQLTGVMLLVVTGVGLLVHVYSIGYMHGDHGYTRFFAYLNLFLAAMLMLVLGSSLLMVFIGWEGVGLASYLLIGFWFDDAANSSAGTKAFITNRVGDVAFMIAMFLAFSTFGTLGLLDVIGGADTLSSTTAFALVLLLMGGAAAKSAQIPLYVWLPDAMAGPTPVSALIHAATMVTAGVYLTVRVSPVVVTSVDAMTLIAWIGALTALLAALIALRQDDIKKILAYSTVSQLGFMFIGVGVGAFREAIFHLVTHAFFKGLLFLAAGSVMHAFANRTDIWRMGGLRKVMPITFATSAAAWLAISGVFPFAGFFSKDQILTTAYEHGFTGVWAVGLLTAAITAFYMSRWFFLLFFGEPRWREGETVHDPHGHGETSLHPHESPPSMTAPLVVLAVLSLVGGWMNFVHDGPFLGFLEPVIAGTSRDYLAHGPLTEPVLIALSLVAAAVGIAGAYFAYLRRDVSAGRAAEVIGGVPGELLERKFFVDELYEAVFVRFGGWLAGLAVWFDTRVVDGAVNGVGAASRGVADVARRAQSGTVRAYVGSMVAGALVVVAVLVAQVV